jgi:hypothetical protein
VAGYWKQIVVNPMPVADAGNGLEKRQWVALHSSGAMVVSHGLKVPSDTADQPNRPWIGGSAPGSWTKPRWGWPQATTLAYQADVGQGLEIIDWTAGALKGYVHDNYGALWPFGEDTPVVAAATPTTPTGAPFGMFPLGDGSQYYSSFAMHSSNGLPFGKGGFADGYGWMLGFDGGARDGGFKHWGGPITLLTAPPTVPNVNVVRDLKVNPNGGGGYYVLYDNGWIFDGSAVGGSGHDGIVTTPRSPGGYGPQPAGGPGLGGGRHFWWIHVQWDEGWIVSVDTDGNTWGYYLESNAFSTGKPIPGGLASNAGGFFTGRGAIVPPRNPTRYFLLGSSGTVVSVPLTGTIQPSNPGFGAGVGTTPTETTQPTITWTFDELDAAGLHVCSQRSYSTRVYPVAVTTAPGFVAGQTDGTIWLNDKAQLVETPPGTGSDKIGHNLTNGAVYVVYVRLTDSAGQVGGWDRLGGVSGTFTENVPLPTPTSYSVTATVHPGAAFVPPAGYTFGKVTIAVGGGAPPAGQFLQYQVSVEGSGWNNLIGFEATTLTTVDHLIAPTNVGLQYRVRRIKRVPGLVAGPWILANGGASVQLAQPTGTPGGWRLIDPESLGGPAIFVVNLKVLPDTYECKRTKPQGEFTTISSDYWKVEHSGVKGNVHTMTVRVLDRASYSALWAMLSIERPILFLDGFGKQDWVSADPGIFHVLRAAPTSGESTGIRHAWTVDLRLLQTAPEAP